jgi:hypothetical protein
MTRRAGSSSFGLAGTPGMVSGLTLLSVLSGCYGNKTADEELSDFVVPYDRADASSQDAGLPDTGRYDAGSAARCTGSDPIAQLFCSLSTPTAAGMTGNASLDLAGIIEDLGGLETILAILSGIAGGGTGNTRMPDALNAAGGLGDLATLLNAVLGTSGTTPNPLGALLGTFGQTGASGTTTPSLADLLAALGAPNAASASTVPRGAGTMNKSVITMPTPAQCVSPDSQETELLCLLQQAAR